MFLNDKLLEGKLTLKEIISMFKIKFPYLGIKLSEDSLREYAQQSIVGWKERISEGLGEIVEEEIKQIPEAMEDFVGEEKKIDQIQKHRQLLREYWKNYLRIKFVKRQEVNKAKYLEDISKELVILQNLEEAERGLLSMMSEIREAEERESPDEHRDYIEGWCLQTLAKKCKSKSEAIKQLGLLQEKIYIFNKILDQKGIEEGIKEYLKILYTPK